MTTATEIINQSLKSIGQLAEGETPSPETSSDCLDLLNELIDSWNNERLMVPWLTQENFTLSGGTGTYTVGSGATLNTTRPTVIDDASFTRLNDIDYPLRNINAAQYNSITDKDEENSWPNVFYYEASYPTGTIKFYPVPSQAITFYMVSWKQLSTLSSLSTSFSVAPGTLRAIRSNLAIEIASNFGVEAPPSVRKAAMDSKRNLKRVHAPNDVLAMPRNILRRTGQGNIYGDIT